MLAGKIALAAGDPEKTKQVYDDIDPIVYDAMCQLVKYSDEQVVVGEAIFKTED